MLTQQLCDDPQYGFFTAVVLHFSALLVNWQDNAEEWPHCICDRELVALRLVSQRGKRIVEALVPCVFTLCPPPLGPLDTPWCLQRLMRFYVMAPDTLIHLWRPEILATIQHYHHHDGDAGRDMIRRIMMRLINGVRHSTTNNAYSPCILGEYACPVCALSSVRAAFTDINNTGFLFLETIQASNVTCEEYMNKAHVTYDQFMDRIEFAGQEFRTALCALNLNKDVADSLRNALTTECRRRLEPAARRWAEQILWQCDLYTYLRDSEGSRSPLYSFVWMACQSTQLDYAGARESIRAFYERHVTSKDAWYSAPTNFQRLLHALTPKLSFRLATNTLLLERALHHLVQQYQILDTGELVPVARHIIGCFNELRITSPSPDMIAALLHFVRALQGHPDGRTVIDQLYTTPRFSDSHCNLQRLVQENVPRDAGRSITGGGSVGGIPAHALIMDPLGDSVDPLELFLRQGRHDPCTVGTHLFNVEHVILAMDLQEFAEYLELANALFPAVGWSHGRANEINSMPYALVALLGLHYGRLVCGKEAMERRETTVRRSVRDAAPPVDWTDCDEMAVECEPHVTVCRIESTTAMLEFPSPHLHQVMQRGVECARILNAARVYPEEVTEWLNRALRGYVAAARRAMFGDAWLCSCGREYGECAAEMQRLYLAAPQHGSAYLSQLQSLEQEYGDALLYQGDNQRSWT